MSAHARDATAYAPVLYAGEVGPEGSTMSLRRLVGADEFLPVSLPDPVTSALETLFSYSAAAGRTENARGRHAAIAVDMRARRRIIEARRETMISEATARDQEAENDQAESEGRDPATVPRAVLSPDEDASLSRVVVAVAESLADLTAATRLADAAEAGRLDGRNAVAQLSRRLDAVVGDAVARVQDDVAFGPDQAQVPAGLQESLAATALANRVRAEVRTVIGDPENDPEPGVEVVPEIEALTEAMATFLSAEWTSLARQR